MAMAVSVGTSHGLTFSTAKPFLRASLHSFFSTAFFRPLRAPRSLNWARELPFLLFLYFFWRFSTNFSRYSRLARRPARTAKGVPWRIRGSLLDELAAVLEELLHAPPGSRRRLVGVFGGPVCSSDAITNHSLIPRSVAQLRYPKMAAETSEPISIQ